MNESKMMPAAECATHILTAITERKRTLVLTFTGIRTVWMNKLFPNLTDKLVHRFFFKKGKLIQ
jgi:short-subunit dehydrogenase